MTGQVKRPKPRAKKTSTPTKKAIWPPPIEPGTRAEFVSTQLSGWLSPVGEIYPCPFYGHTGLAGRLVRQLYPEYESTPIPDSILIRLGWQRISQGGADLVYAKPATQAQLDWIYDTLEEIKGLPRLPTGLEPGHIRELASTLKEFLTRRGERNPRSVSRETPRIAFVDGCSVRDRYDVEFTMGGHHWRYAFIPSGEIWIDFRMCGKDLACTVFHELVERRIMKDLGWRYGTAHDRASQLEILFRRDVPADLPQELALEVALARWAEEV